MFQYSAKKQHGNLLLLQKQKLKEIFKYVQKNRRGKLSHLPTAYSADIFA